ncbi:MAG TPA: MauE/DoxX family redox-associated membrane protein [Gammaproteobacteria bacterium]|jgi:copper chaperone CopZ|nr:MauE/DoxX family redox-associated membrane protein [Gammaproteobacteria bacterium]
MDFTYKIKGVRCHACLGKIKTALQPIESSIKLSLDPPTLKLISIEKIMLDDLNIRIKKAGDYHLSPVIIEDTKILAPANQEKKNRSWFNVYYSLLLILTYLFIVSLTTSFSSGRINWHLWMGHFMAGFFIIFSFFKFLDLSGFADTYANYDLLAKRWIGYGYIYPFLEFGLGFAYLIQFAPTQTYIITVVLMAFSSLGVIKALLKKQKIQCACLGTILNLPMSNITLIEDFSMIVMAIIMLMIE